MNLFFLNIILKKLVKRDVFSVINLLGLSIGLAVVLLISLLVFNERSFDKAFKEGNNIYRINSFLTGYRAGETWCGLGSAAGPAFKEAVPEILTAVRTIRRELAIKINDNPIRIEVMYADEDFFQLFDTPFLFGAPETALSRPNTVAISEEESKRLFGTVNSVGETFLVDNRTLMEIAAVYKDYHKNSSFWEYKMISSLPHMIGTNVTWMNAVFETFCLLPEKVDTAQVAAKLRNVVLDANDGWWWYYPLLQRLDEIHLHSAKFVRSYTSSQSDIGKVKMMSLLAVIILAVACINYMNLSTARAQKRSKEIGLNKTLGAKRYELAFRLFIETGIFTLVSFIFAFLLAWGLLPKFNDLLGEHLQIGLALQPMFLCGALLIWLAATVLAAAYPAIYLSSFPPLMAIGSGFMPTSSHAAVRKVLNVGQFAVAVILISWVFIIQAQINFMNNTDLGYNPRNLMYLSLGSLAWNTDIGPLVNDFNAESSVEMATRHSSPFFSGTTTTIAIDETDDNVGLSVVMQVADPNHIDFMQMKMIAGRPLPEWQPGDSIIRVILNRAAVEYIGMTPEEVIGTNVRLWNFDNNEVCGVVENFHFESLHTPVRGFGFHNRGRPNSVIMLRLREGNLAEQLQRYEQIFKNHFPNELFEPQFFDSQLAKAYEDERRTNRVAIVFSVLAIFVACMGVFGLTAFMAEQRTKEIGVRKVLGASIVSVVSLFTANYVKLLLISLLIAIPAAWWVGERYLQEFAYRISLSWWIFAFAALITIALTLLTVCILAIKAAMADPVKSLKTQ